MTLGEVIKKYRDDHDLSMADFAELSGMSKAYVSLLEKGTRPGSNKPIDPSTEMVTKTARAMGMTTPDLWRLITDGQQLNWDSAISMEDHDEKDEELLADIWANKQRILSAYHDRLMQSYYYPYKNEIEDILRTMTGAQLKQVLTFAQYLKWEGMQEKEKDKKHD